MKKVKISMIFNICIFVLALLGTIFMLTGFQFMSKSEVLTSSRWESFKYFTVDSNILVGICSFLLLIQEGKFLLKNQEIPRIYYLLKYISTAGVLLTFLVTACFLAPFSHTSFFDFYQNSNLFFHFIVPVLSVISLLVFERGHIVFRDTFLSLIPMCVYSIYYLTMILTHLENGKVSWDYDFYGFLRWGFSSIFLVIPIIFLVCYGIGFFLYFFQRKKSE